MKVYDCFTFYNEFELLELRLKSLWDVVDYFVISEADKTHANKPKPYYFWERQDEFKKFFPKIIHLPVEMTVPYGGVGDWSIENAQRDAVIYGLADAEPDDLIMISDLDEIPAPDVLQRIYSNQATVTFEHVLPEISNKKKRAVKCVSLTNAADLLEEYPLVMEQKFFYYYFDLVSVRTWRGTILTKQKNLTMPQEFRNIRNELPRVAEGGWHFSYMGGVDRIINKMTSIVDGNEFVIRSGGKLIDKKYLEDCLANGKDLYGRTWIADTQLLPYDAKNIRLPHLYEFLKKYPFFLREPEKYFGGRNFYGTK